MTLRDHGGALGFERPHRLKPAAHRSRSVVDREGHGLTTLSPDRATLVIHSDGMLRTDGLLFGIADREEPIELGDLEHTTNTIGQAKQDEPALVSVHAAIDFDERPHAR